MEIRATKSQVIKLISENAPLYIGLFTKVRASANGWLVWPKKYHQILTKFGIHSYVTLYKNDATINSFLAFFLFGRSEFISLTQDLIALPEDQRQIKADSLIHEILNSDQSALDQMLDKYFDLTDELLKSNQDLSIYDESSNNDDLERVKFLWIHVFLSIHNIFSVMVNGESMVSLVPKAINGDDLAFCNAIKIDPNLLQHHSYFVDRIEKAKLKGEAEFIQAAEKYRAKPNLVGRIRLPSVYVVFAMLEMVGWLDDFSHEEILDICNSPNFARWQCQINEANSITKLLKNYRKYQNTCKVSMH